LAVQALKGFKDTLPGEVEQWQKLERTAREIFHRFGFSEIRVPILEKTELFARSIGEATDIVEKEMYTFVDRNGESITMRPEGTASVLRAYIEHGLYAAQAVQRLYTIGPMFRHERPQKGRLRQFHQLSVEAVGSAGPQIDIEVVAMARMLLEELAVPAAVELNSLGCAECRGRFRQELVAFLDGLAGKLCPDCERRRTTNPLRVLDCKSTGCKEYYQAAPRILDHLCAACADHFTAVQSGLTRLAIPFTINPFMVRGLDYYTRTTFELTTDLLGAQSAIGAGGRYDGLVRQLGGPDLPGIGFAMGIERLILLLGQTGAPAPPAGPDLFLIALGEEAAGKGFGLAHALRRQGMKTLMDPEGRSLKSQMKQANRANAAFVLILGEEEVRAGAAPLRNMKTAAQESVQLVADIAELVEAIRRRLKTTN